MQRLWFIRGCGGSDVCVRKNGPAFVSGDTNGKYECKNHRSGYGERVAAGRNRGDLPQGYVYDSIRYGKELRDRYTILQFMWDLGKLDEAAEKLVEKYCKES